MMAKPLQVTGDVELLGVVWLGTVGGIQNCWGPVAGLRMQHCWALYLDEGCSTAGRGFSRLGGAALLERCRKVGAQRYWGEVPPCSVPLM